jgi:phosphonate dehydrogenase
MKPKVVITHWVHQEVIHLLKQSCEVIANDGKESMTREEILHRTRDAHGIMVFMPDSVDDGFLNACPNLKIVSAALKGYDNFDVDACTRRGIWFSIVPDLLTIPTAELAVGLLIGLTRRVFEGDALIRSGQFEGWRPKLYGTGLNRTPVGIVGMGALGQAVAGRLAGFGVELQYADRLSLPEDKERSLGLRYVSLNSLLAESRFVILCAPLTRDTFHLIDENALLQMKPCSFLINVCRGSVVDEDAVARALESGHLGGYAADVFEFEDWVRKDRPAGIPAALLSKPSSTLFTPHLGSAVDDIRRDIALEAAHNVVQAFQGKRPPGAINEVASTARLISP